MARLPDIFTFTFDMEIDNFFRYGRRIGLSVILHPFQYARMLIMLGYEPIAAIPGKSLLFDENVLRLPNVFQYVFHIGKIDGILGCYRGLAPRVVGSMLAMLINDRVADRLRPRSGSRPQDVKDESQLTEAEVYNRFKSGMKLDLVLTVIGVVVSHPFHVISLRMMAQFVGRETVYTSNMGSLGDIWTNEGIGGLFAGLLPKLLYDVGFLVVNGFLVFFLNKFVFTAPESREFNVGITEYAVWKALNPLQVVSTCLAVAGSGLKASQPPNMPVYGNPLACWKDLLGRGQLFRGNSLFGRTQSIPTNAILPDPDL